MQKVAGTALGFGPPRHLGRSSNAVRALPVTGWAELDAPAVMKLARSFRMSVGAMLIRLYKAGIWSDATRGAVIVVTSPSGFQIQSSVMSNQMRGLFPDVRRGRSITSLTGDPRLLADMTTARTLADTPPALRGTEERIRFVWEQVTKRPASYLVTFHVERHRQDRPALVLT